MVKHLLADFAKFEEELSREHYLHSSGQKDDLQSAQIYKKFKHLFSREHIAEAQKDVGTKEGRMLYDAFVGSFIGNQVKKISDKAQSFEASATVSVDGKEIPFRHVSSLLVNEDVREKRKALYDSTKPVKRKLTSFEKRLWKKDYVLLKELTGKNYVDYVSWTKGVDYATLAGQLRDFLVKTENLHKKQLAKNMGSINVKASDARPYDYAYYARAKPFDAFFKKEKLVEIAKTFWKDLGIDIDSQKNVILDVEERPKKVPRAFCMPLKVPEEVYLVIKPQGGQDDYQAFLHESGQTEQFENTDGSLSYELKHMGDYSVSETYAFLIEYLLANPLFLQKYVEMPKEKAQEFAGFIMEQKLQAFRRYAAKVIYELKLHRNDLKKLDKEFLPTEGEYTSAAAMYVDILTKATKIKYAKESYLLDVDAGLYAADYVRAWLFEVMVRKRLEEKFGGDWFSKRESGEFLKNMWKCGNSGKSVAELAQSIGYAGVDICYLTDDFLQFFKA